MANLGHAFDTAAHRKPAREDSAPLEERGERRWDWPLESRGERRRDWPLESAQEQQSRA